MVTELQGDERKQAVLLYVVGFCHDMVAAGLMAGGIGGYLITEEGRRNLERLRESGFEPTGEEFGEAFAALAEKEEVLTTDGTGLARIGEMEQEGAEGAEGRQSVGASERQSVERGKLTEGNEGNEA